MTDYNEINDDKALLTWFGEQSFAKEMKECMQDAEWHGEGDVYIHSLMAFEELLKVEGWAKLPAEEQFILKMAVLLHDIGKPAVTQVIDGRLRSPKHGPAGMRMARHVLNGLNMPYLLRERILRLIRYHSMPVHVLKKRDPVEHSIYHSHKVENHLLYYLALADNRGRVSSDIEETVTNLHLWKELCLENSCFDSPYPFTNDQARLLFYHKELTSLDYTPYEQYGSKVYLMSGLPGAGKDHWIGRNLPELPVVSLDEIRRELRIGPRDKQGRVVQVGRERAKEYLRAGQDFVLNLTNITRDIRSKWTTLCADYRARIHIVYIEPSFNDILKQNRGRRHQVPEKVIQDLFARLELPDLSECHEISYF